MLQKIVDIDSVDVKVLVALITGIVSLLVAIFNIYFGKRNQESLERFKTDLSRESELTKSQLQKEVEFVKAQWADRNSAEAAKRAYQYDAIKRLYEQVEPILFQLYEALEEAHYRVRSLARTSRDANLTWLANGGYYLNSTVYKLILPAAFFRLLQRRVTFVDIKLDNTVGLRYLLLKLYSRSYTDDFVLASIPPVLRYDPNNIDWNKLVNQEPSVYMQQGILVGDLEKIADILLTGKDAAVMRPMFFSEFEHALKNCQDGVLAELVESFRGFSPQKRPIMRRILITQAVLAQLILSTYHPDQISKGLDSQLSQILLSRDLLRELAWTKGADASEDLRVAGLYIAERLQWIHTSYSSLKLHS